MKTRRSAVLAAATAIEIVIALLIAVLIHNSNSYKDNFIDLNSGFKSSDLKEYARVRIEPDFVSYPFDQTDTDPVKASYLLGITDSDCDFKFLVRLIDTDIDVESANVIEGHLVKSRPSSGIFKLYKKEGFNVDEAGSLLLPYSIDQTELPKTDTLWTVLAASAAVYLILFIILIPKHRTKAS